MKVKKKHSHATHARKAKMKACTGANVEMKRKQCIKETLTGIRSGFSGSRPSTEHESSRLTKVAASVLFVASFT